MPSYLDINFGMEYTEWLNVDVRFTKLYSSLTVIKLFYIISKGKHLIFCSSCTYKIKYTIHYVCINNLQCLIYTVTLKKIRKKFINLRNEFIKLIYIELCLLDFVPHLCRPSYFLLSCLRIQDTLYPFKHKNFYFSPHSWYVWISGWSVDKSSFINLIMRTILRSS